MFSTARSSSNAPVQDAHFDQAVAFESDADAEQALPTESIGAQADAGEGAQAVAVRPKKAKMSYWAAALGALAGFVLAAGLWAPIDNLDEVNNPLAPALDAFATYMRGEDAADVAAWSAQATQYQSKASALTKGQQQLVGFLAKKYRTASSEVRKMVAAAYAAGADTKLDPLLILAVMSIESNLNPLVESSAGALGLMQIMPKVHTARFAQYGGLEKIFNIDINVLIGARILQDCIKLGGNTVEGGLKCYVGASGPSDGGYGAKVLAEQARLSRAAAGDFDFTPPKQDLELKPSVELTPIVKLDTSDDAQATAQPASLIGSTRLVAPKVLAAAP